MDNQVLLITSQIALAEELKEDLKEDFPHLTLEITSKKERALRSLSRNLYDVYLLDQKQESESGIDWLETAMRQGCAGSVLFLGPEGDRSLDIASLQHGAEDYISWNSLTPEFLDRKVRFARRHLRNKKLLLAQQERYRALFYQSTNPVFIADNRHEIIEYNGAMMGFCGVTGDRYVNVSDLFKSEKDYAKFQRKLMKFGFVRNFETTLLDSNDNMAHCLLSMVRLSEAMDMSHSFLGILYDMTEFKKIQRQNERSKVLSISSKFTRMIAHEIRNPLTNINLSVQQLKSDFQENIMEDIPFYADIIERNSVRINDLISSMLKTSKPLSLDIQSNDMRSMIKDALTACEDRIELMEVKCIVSKESPDVDVEIDKDKFKIAIVNIIINAIEAMSEVKSPKLKIEWELHEDEVKLMISDNGKGMDAKQLERIFEPFYTGRNSGIGLGMTTTLNILKSHDAKIDVDSKLGEGTSFKIWMHKQLAKADDEAQLIL